MKKYRFRVYTKSDPHDGFNVWASGDDLYEAKREIENEYRNAVRIEFICEIK